MAEAFRELFFWEPNQLQMWSNLPKLETIVGLSHLEAQPPSLFVPSPTCLPRSLLGAAGIKLFLTLSPFLCPSPQAYLGACQAGRNQYKDPKSGYQCFTEVGPFIAVCVTDVRPSPLP